MSDIQRVSRNILYVYIANIVTAVVTPILYIVIARLLGTEKFGVFSFAMSFAGLFVILAEFGISKLIIREIAMDRDRAPTYYGELIVMKPIIAFVVLLLFSVVVIFLNKPSEAKISIVVIGLSVILFGSFARLFDAIFQAFEKMQYITIINTLTICLNALFGIIALVLTKSLVIMSLSLALSYLFSYLIEFFMLNSKITKPVTRMDYRLWKKIITDAIPFATTGLFIVVFSYADTIIISFMKGDEAVGIYSAAYKIVWLLFMIPTAVMASLYPYLSSKIMDSSFSKELIIERVLTYLFAIALPLVIIISSYSLEIVTLLYGKEYIDSAKPLSILIFIPLFCFLYIPLYDFLNVNFFQKINAANIIVCTILNVALCFMLIPKWNYSGASLATLITEGLLFILSYYFSVTRTNIHVQLGKFIRICLAGIVLFMVVFFLPRSLWYYSCPGGILIYSGLLLILKVIKFEEVKYLIWGMLGKLGD